MFVTKKAISRRTVLRGAGTAVALPLLDAMIPAFAPAAATSSCAPLRRGLSSERRHLRSMAADGRRLRIRALPDVERHSNHSRTN